MSLFALDGSKALGEKIACELQLPLSPLEEIDFEDGEHKVRPLVSVKNQDVFVLHSLYGEPGRSTNDKLCRLLFLVGALRDAWAARVTVLLPYLCYSRKDRRSKEDDPVCTRYLAQMFEAVGVGGVITMDVHNQAAFENSHRCPNRNLEAMSLFAKHFAAELQGQSLAVVSPDSGGVKRAEAFRDSLQGHFETPISKAFVEKIRENDEVWGHTLVGDVKDRTVLILDDLIASGTTLAKAAQACKEQGASKVYAAATHGVFTEESNQILATPALEHILITDSVPPFRIQAESVKSKLQIVSSVPLWVESLRQA